jgi:hypothetical protein
MMGQMTGGIRIKPISPIAHLSDVNALKILNESTTLLELQTNWSKLSKQEQSLPTVITLKDKFKNRFK